MLLGSKQSVQEALGGDRLSYFVFSVRRGDYVARPFSDQMTQNVSENEFHYNQMTQEASDDALSPDGNAFSLT